MRDRARISECEHKDRLESVLKNTFNTQLRPLRSLETATKKRRAHKKDGKQFRVHEINEEDLRLMRRSRSTRFHEWVPNREFSLPGGGAKECFAVRQSRR
jgi:hypothetical protein